MVTSIPLAKPDITPEEFRAVYDALKSGYLTYRGEYAAKFELLFKKRFKCEAMATSSGTAALHLALLSAGIGKGDDVIVPVLTFGGTAAVVEHVGARCMFVDVTENYCMDWSLVKQAMRRNTKAIIPVHLYGEQCEFEKKQGITIIEDSCEALGYVEPSADYTAYSFFANKVMTTGEGGMLLGPADRRIRNGGFTPDYDMEVPGLNYRMTNLQSAIGCAQFARLPEILRARDKVVEVYNRYLNGRGKWMYVVQVDDPKELAAVLAKQGVETRPVFMPLHLTQAFKRGGDFPVAERLWRHGLCLPVGSHITEQQAIMIAKTVRDYGQRHSQAA